MKISGSFNTFFTTKENVMTSNTAQTIRRGILALGLIAIAIIHVLDLPSKWAEVRYLGFGYIGVIIASLILAERVIRKPSSLDYFATAALSASVLAGFTITRTVGLPGAMDDIGNWLEPLGLVSILVEAIVIWHATQALREKPSVRVVQNISSKNDELIAA